MAALKQENMTVADLRRNLERTVIAQRVQQAEVFGRVAVTDDEAHKYYDSHHDRVHDAVVRDVAGSPGQRSSIDGWARVSTWPSTKTPEPKPRTSARESPAANRSTRFAAEASDSSLQGQRRVDWDH